MTNQIKGLLKGNWKYIVIALLILFNLKGCYDSDKELKKHAKLWGYKEQMYLHNEETLVRDTTEKGEELVTQRTLAVTKGSELEKALIENTRLKNIKSQIKVVTKTEVRDVFIPFSTIDSSGVDSIPGSKAPRVFRVDNKWYGISGKVLSNGVNIDSLYFNNEISVTVGYKKDKGMKHLFQKPYPVVEVVNANPHSKVGELYNVTVEPKPKKFYQRDLFKVGVGMVLGAYIVL
jgi:hypothetical protein